MKRSIVLVVIVCGIRLNAQSHGTVDLDVGLVVRAGVDGVSLYDEPVFDATIHGVLPVLTYGFIDANVTTWMLFGSLVDGFNPILSSFKVGAGVVYDRLTIGWVHECTHPVVATGVQLIFGNAAYDRLYMTYEWRF